MKTDRLDVCVLGLGYIGLPTAALLANRNCNVHGVDINEQVVETINKGKKHIIEPELDTFLRSAVRSNRLQASTEPREADIFIIAVPTPLEKGNRPNISYILDATKKIASHIQPGNLIILESTSPVGTTQKIKQELERLDVNTEDLHFAYCPERVLPGSIMRELIENDRVVGGLTPEATQKAKQFYKRFVEGEILTTDAKTAEMVKLTENSYRDVNIALANELSILCDDFGINVQELIRLANHHPRVNILQPGVGVGGHCIAIDPWFIIHKGGDKAKLLKTSREVNRYKTAWVIEKIKNEALRFQQKHDKKPRLACMGLSYKPNIDDLRESPALYITKQLQKEDNELLTVEPNIDQLDHIPLVSAQEAVQEADIIAFLVAHKEFYQLDIPENKVQLDFCNLHST